MNSQGYNNYDRISILVGISSVRGICRCTAINITFLSLIKLFYPQHTFKHYLSFKLYYSYN